MSSKRKKVYVAMSGGVDSSVAATLLKDQGYDVTGVYMDCVGPPVGGGCDNKEEKRDAMRVAAILDVSFETWDFRDEYKKEVYEYMISEYRAGRTPNPDVMCNKQIKFGVFLDRALKEGADFMATGHYVRVSRGKGQGARGKSKTLPLTLYPARDSAKDQSYFLWTLTQEQLKHCLFPIGEYTKSKVRALAKKFKLPTAQKKDSQGLCFVGNVNFADFIKERIPQSSGAVLNTAGKKIGEHDGAHFYTIGQRHGVFVQNTKHSTQSTKPLYVAEKNLAQNTIIVAEEKDSVLHKKEIKVSDINWINHDLNDLKQTQETRIFARIRYRQPLQSCTLYAVRDTSYVKFEQPQRAVSPGQSIVFYAEDGDMLGGGVITS